MLDLKKEELRKQLIEIKKQHYKQIIGQIYKKNVIPIIGIEVLGITESNKVAGEGDILYKVTKRDRSKETYEVSIKKKENKTLYKITKPDSQTIEVNTDFWLFKEDMEG